LAFRPPASLSVAKKPTLPNRAARVSPPVERAIYVHSTVVYPTPSYSLNVHFHFFLPISRRLCPPPRFPSLTNRVFGTIVTNCLMLPCDPRLTFPFAVPTERKCLNFFRHTPLLPLSFFGSMIQGFPAILQELALHNDLKVDFVFTFFGAPECVLAKFYLDPPQPPVFPSGFTPLSGLRIPVAPRLCWISPVSRKPGILLLLLYFLFIASILAPPSFSS